MCSAGTTQCSTCVGRPFKPTYVFDGEIAKGYSCAKTKHLVSLTIAIAPTFLSELVTLMKQSYSFVDGSNGTGLLKTNRLLLDSYRGKVDTDMSTINGSNFATAVSEVLTKQISHG